VNARTALGDHATGKMLEEVLRRTLAVLVEEGEKATEEAQRYMEEIGIRPE
jgi:polyhydroxyalkanoate synthesis regulator phasin